MKHRISCLPLEKNLPSPFSLFDRKWRNFHSSKPKKITRGQPNINPLGYITPHRFCLVFVKVVTWCKSDEILNSLTYLAKSNSGWSTQELPPRTTKRQPARICIGFLRFVLSLILILPRRRDCRNNLTLHVYFPFLICLRKIKGCSLKQKGNRSRL